MSARPLEPNHTVMWQVCAAADDEWRARSGQTTFHGPRRGVHRRGRS